MKKSSHSRFWKLYRFITGLLLLLIVSFFVFFYDYIGAYEKSQPIYAAERYALSLNEAEWRMLCMEKTAASSTVFESPERIADAYCLAFRSMGGDIAVQSDHTSSTAEMWQYTITKGNIPIASVSVASESEGKYGFRVWEIHSADVISEHLAIEAADYDITVPSGSIVSVNGRVLDELFLSSTDAAYGFAHPLEKADSIPCDMYTVRGLLAVPEVQCVWNGTVCNGELVDRAWQFAYPASQEKAYVINAPTEATVFVNDIALNQDYITDERPYSYSVYDSTDTALPTETVYRVSGLLYEPKISAVLGEKELSGTLEGNTFHYPYPDAMMYRQILCVPQNSVVYVNGYVVGDGNKEQRAPAYPELFGDGKAPVYMDRYVLSGVYGASDDVQVMWNGTDLRIESSREGRVLTYNALYPDTTHEEVHSTAVSFCKDYFAYTAGGYKNTEENLGRVLSYLSANSELYRRIARSKESVGFVTPVKKQIFHNLTVESMEELSDSLVVCSVSYDIEQWTYQVKRTYSGKLQLAFESIDQQWVLSHMLTDTK